MDTITHVIVGYAVVKTGLTKDTGTWGVIAGVTASLFPDVDGLLAFFYGTEFTIKYHRGLTNSILLVVPVSLLFAWLFVKISGKKRFETFFIIWLVLMLTHTLLDLITSFGTMILSPISSYRFALDWVFIIDLFLTGIFLIFSVAIMVYRTRGQTLARISVVLGALYILICAGNHFWSLSLAESHAREQQLKPEKIASLPQPLSPFHWANYIVTDDTIYLGLVNLIGTHERTLSETGNIFSQVWNRYQPIRSFSYDPWPKFSESPLVKKAVALESVETFFWFARFPVVKYQANPNGNHRVKFFDLRFSSVEGRWPFLYEVIFDASGEIVFQGFQSDHSTADRGKRFGLLESEN